MSSSSPSRRRFLQQTVAAALVYNTRRLTAQMQDMSHPMSAAPAHQSPTPMLHVLELPPFVDALPFPETHPAHAGKLRVTMREIHAQVHRDLPPTRMWSYGPSALAPVIEARSGHPLQVEWINNLPTQHFLPIDFTLHGCGRDLPQVRTVAHVHGTRVPSKDDGFPTDWFAPGKSRTCTYPLQQDAATLWYHDHAMGLNRLNIYAGLFGMFLIRDHAEDALHLPSGKYEVPLILYDRDFTADGQLFYPTSGDPDHPWVSEFDGDAILINGKIRPYLEVEPRLYRFRLLNSSNSRFFNLSLDTGQPLIQIGSDQGLLTAPTNLAQLILAPAERADILLDLTPSAGHTIHLRNGAFDILQLRVAKTPDPASLKQQAGCPIFAAPFAAKVGIERSETAFARLGGEANRLSSHASDATSCAPVPKTLRAITRIPESAAIRTRTITLNEYQDKVGNSMLMLLNRQRWHEPVTEQPRLNTTEIWEFVNLTEDIHPMHLHLVRFQLLDRRRFDVFQYLMYKNLRYTAEAVPPSPSESGWKDTIQCPPKSITRIIARFEGYTGHYLYHCHILEHESNDMMRPFEVIA